jgi:hypothetical protein
MALARERFKPVVVAANTAVTFDSNAIGCFLCKTAGTITMLANPQDGKAATTIISAHPVTAGTYYPLPFYVGTNGGTFTTAGGASGTLGV